MNLIQNTILTSLPAGRKKTPSGWISFNAPCCVYNGESADKKKRGGIMTSADGTVSYHCFNCGFKASYVIGRKLTFKMRQFMSYIGVPEDTIRKLAIEAMREEEGDVKYEKKKFVTFKNKTLPKNAHKLDVWLEKYVGNDLTEPQWKKIDGLLKYLEGRGIGADWYDFMYSPDKVWDVHQRLLIPFYWRGDVVGFTGRMFEESQGVKYYTDVWPGYVFNMDAQDWNRKFVIVTEGPFDAITISGVSSRRETDRTSKRIWMECGFPRVGRRCERCSRCCGKIRKTICYTIDTENNRVKQTKDRFEKENVWLTIYSELYRSKLHLDVP